ncbi:MAG: carbon storage regulator [Succinivibrio sp.]|jgi:carbon storage regulator|nr:carbon storage regulator [Succinivibrio sp.]MBR1613365.1 carbon storage regulator [Succinivibrio sp.]
MLVISQKVGDKIQLGSGITVSVLSVKGGKVRLGIDAPQSVEIKRVASDQKKKTSSPYFEDRS